MHLDFVFYIVTLKSIEQYIVVDMGTKLRRLD